MTEEEYDKIARTDCFVCCIVKGEPLIKDPEIIYEDERVIAFLNQLPTQIGYTLVSPKKHVERFEDMEESEWIYLQKKVQEISKAVSESTAAIRVYLASLGSPERNAHLHIHICPCPPGTPLEKQQFAAMDNKGEYIKLSKEEANEIATKIRANLNIAKK